MHTVHYSSAVDPVHTVHYSSTIDSVHTVHYSSAVDPVHTVHYSSTIDSVHTVHYSSAVDPAHTVHYSSTVDPVHTVHYSSTVDPVHTVHYSSTADPAGYVYAVNFVREGQSGEGLTVKLNGGEIHQTWLPTKDGKKVNIYTHHCVFVCTGIVGMCTTVCCCAHTVCRNTIHLKPSANLKFCDILY